MKQFTCLLLGFLWYQFTWAQAPQSPRPNPYEKDIPKLMTIPNVVDSNQDGELSLHEVLAAPQQLATLDSNGDGRLDWKEMGALENLLPFIRNHNITNLIDADGNVDISVEEIKNASESLKYLDVNNDWHISKKEMAISKFKRFPIFSARGMKLPVWEHFRAYNANNEGAILPGKNKDEYKAYTLVHESGDNGLIHMSNTTYLLNENGEKVHEWKYQDGHYSPEASVAYLLPNGQLLRTLSKHNWTKDKHFPVGAYSSVELLNWDGTVLWEFTHSVPKKYSLHHDVAYLPNGNILAIGYNGFSVEDEDEGVVWMSNVVELQPNLEDGSTEIVWQWNSWDHYVQNKFPDKPNYGEADNIHKININYLNLDKGVLGNKGQFFHLNAVDYNPELDLVLLSCPTYGEFWIIDHSTSTQAAAGSQGGKYNKGGDLLYRWGNPHAIGKGTKNDKVLYFQHNAHWIEAGKPGAGNILVYNNGGRRTLDGNFNKQFKAIPFGEAYSDILEIEIPLDTNGQFNYQKDAAIVWSWQAENKADYFSPFMSGVSRLPNGNTIFCKSYDKQLIEVNPKGKKVLDYKIAGWGRIYRVYKFAADYSGLRF